jgi:hypothetical protein
MPHAARARGRRRKERDMEDSLALENHQLPPHPTGQDRAEGVFFGARGP